jgi:polysaccharide biosynthesis transport protein
MVKTSFKRPAQYDIPRLTLRDVLGPLFRHRLAALVTFCLVFLCCVLVAWLWAAHYYVASMQIVVGRERLDPAVTAQPTAAVQETSKIVTTDDVASEVALLQGTDMLREVVQTCNLVREDASSASGLDANARGLEKAAALEGATKGLASSLKVDSEKTSRVIDVRYGTTDSPESAACVLRTLGKVYLEKHLRLQRPAGALEFFAQETDRYQHALSAAENQLVQFSKTEGIAAPEILRASLAQQLVTTQGNLHESNEKIAADLERLQNLRNQLQQTPARSSTAETSLAANSLLEQLHSSLLASQLKKTQLLMKYDPSYPLVKEVDKEIEQTNQAIADAENSKYLNTTTDRDPTFEYLREDKAKTEADLASEQARAAALQTSIQGMHTQMVDWDAKAIRQEALLREAKANEGNYLLYLTKREQERTSDALDNKRIANVAIAVPAEVPLLPAHNPFSIIFAGFWLAVAAGVGAGYLAELADPSFRTPSEVEEMLNIPIIAAVPKRAA